MGMATLTTAWGLWDVATDIKSDAVPKGTKYDVLGSCTYHKSKKNPDGFTGYLVNHKGRLHVLPSKDVSTFTPSTSITAAVDIRFADGTKYIGNVTRA